MGATVATFTQPWRGAACDQMIIITRLTSRRFVTGILEEIRTGEKFSRVHSVDGDLLWI